MMLSVDSPSGFYTPGNLEVYRTNKPFYLSERSVYFNLPSGQYEIKTGDIFYVGEMRKFKVPRLPRFERRIAPKPLNITYGLNENKASIDLDTGNVLIDSGFLLKPDFCLRFVELHEFAHYFYVKEKPCDIYAMRKMLSEGFNPYQIYEAANMTFHGKGRINCVESHALKM